MPTDGSLLQALAQSFVTQTGGYFVVVGALFWLFWVAGARRFARRKIQPKRRVDGKQLRFELGHTLGAIVVGTVNAAGVIALYRAGLTRLSEDAADFSAVGIAASFVGLLLFNDLWFYAWHRLLHTPWWFKHVHSVHHKSVDVNPFSSYSFHPVEAFLFGAWFVPAAMIVPLYLPVLGALQVVGLVNNVMSHLGYELLPRWWLRLPLLRWMNTSTFHNLHHSQLRGNYGLTSRVWDRLWGTELPGYAAAFRGEGTATLAAATTQETQETQERAAAP